ncbi:FAD-dependent pyridine nucleotide-disulfide oxidoreductase [Serinicoccus hydrothermalis]|uniref:FAD-dependent pyridine nucleotide-disulfide oxidoreductase n=1 Tax=Serinicoccus hydrothermalis TaxID=1758689 RepID=A0A1B1N9D0_9MICO|nr:FAD-dependent oxidoreductase [Serinicoccus hydrothermalis]ANS78043.1 FAD-dependent pyridine nucleotide-disulfide oxidoreductase [Serinicoccus hydrothermalis]
MARHDVVVVGAGNAGVSLAARLLRVGAKDVAIVSPDRPHLFRPLLNYVAGGQATMPDLTRSTASVIPTGCTWVRDSAVAVHTDEREVELSDGARVGYGDLVLAPGLEEDLDAVPGLAEAMTTGWSLTAHLESQAPAVWDAVRGMSRGRVVFTIPPEPSPCGGTALKPLFLACDEWRRRGVLSDLDVHLVTPFTGILGLPFVDGRLDTQLGELGVSVHHESTVTAVDHRQRTVTVDGPAPTVLDGVDHAFVVPPYRGQGWLAPLAREGAAGQVDVDPETMAHRSAPRVWSLGDAAALDTRPSGGALRRQVEVLADNIASSRLGRPLRRYDGYTIVPVTLDRRRLLLAEFDRTGAQAPTTRLVDLSVPRRALWLFDRYVEPLLYFRALLRGRLLP